MYNMRMSSGKSFQPFSHHAYCIIGGADERAELVSILEKTHGIPTQANPDLFDRSYQTISIDDSREIKAVAGTRPVTTAGKKIFILMTNSITVEAQNALLKLLEEPPEYAHFFLIVPSGHLLLPTVKSRMAFGQGARSKEQGVRSMQEEARRFVTMAPAKRLEVVKSLIEDIAKEKRPKQDALDFLDALQEVIYTDNGPRQARVALEIIETARKYSSDRAPSLKMLLENVALSI